MSTGDTPMTENPDALLCAALLSGLTYEAAAELSGCSRSTVARRMSEPGFRARLDRLRADALARVADLLAAEAIESVATLAAIRADASAPMSVRVRAATALLDSALRYRASIELDARVSALEDALNQRRT